MGWARPFGSTCVIALLAACQGRATIVELGEGSSEATGTNSAGASAPSESGESSEGESTASGAPESEAEADTGTSAGFVDDDGLDFEPCDQWEQACPEGEKCSAAYLEPGETWFSINLCVAIQGDDQLGEPCETFTEEFDGNDSCALGLICVDGYSQDGPVCEAFCGGHAGAPDCGPDATCQIFAAGVATFCIRRCNPLDPGSCGDQEACEVHPHAYPWGTVCAPHPGGAPSGSECSVYQTCDWGSLCEAHLGCESGSCCTQACDPENPVCDDPLAQCVTSGNEAPYDYGLCLVE
jgi:hypothetical protein